ncbi:MAG: hypothetical protein PHV59_05945, partial [Victivallales bacterium]|nr:hypothetical protein [Victivallales bacterium]
MTTNVTAPPACWWRALDGRQVRCLLCPRACVIPDGECGFCAVRKNSGGKLYSLSYGRPVALNIDPIEKKPLAEFLPGSKTFSLGTFGCNLNCSFCQNDSLSRGAYSGIFPGRRFSPEEIVELTL